MNPLIARLKAVSSPAIGLGCMNLSHGYGHSLSEAEGRRALEEAFKMGYRHFDTATLYGATANERLVGRALAGKRDEILLASKCGMAIDPELGRKVIDGRPATLRRQCEASLERMQTDHLDLYYLHRWDKGVPIEESVGELGRLMEEGKIGAIGLSEVSAATLRRARSEHPIAALQTEYSLWTRNPEIAVLEACREADTLLVAFSPLGRGFLAGSVRERESLVEGDVRLGMPRFTTENLTRNLELLTELERLAHEREATTGQLALAWLRAKGDDILPIPGTRRVTHMRENLAAEELPLSADDVTRLDALFAPPRIAGARYAEGPQAEVDTEQFE
ncbi:MULTISPECIES: aldo/keto reductase [unclassified Halomonas]|uniref:aldo/keto reductase n=1 Tax=unclassified Halomonas TaxID=2609666 RepID=UPI002883903E|nr:MULTISPECIES: aldo/keto reductase [unclassified Halomonas]MDT0499992.1 aldo/keto reductase [Halomonas sp. PAR7]MDT0512396.1 aldo/keto reductase [Halomonas sp. LES1]MDT0591030.1 aldo/keto reductase [Halomonas sp. PAR8]